MFAGLDCLLATAWMIACMALPGASFTSTSPTSATTARLNSDLELAAKEAEVNSTARLLAGLAPGLPGHLALAQSEAWREHSAAMQSVWTRIRADRVAAISAWRGEQIPPNCPVGKTLLYPFSGPDFFNAYWLFPDCDTFVMFGLEHPGEAPLVDSNRKPEFARLLGDVRTATADLFNRNYFITQNMTTQLHTSHLRGVVTLIMISMALSGVEILRIAPQELDKTWSTGADSARRMPFMEGGLPAKRVSIRKPQGVAIEFRIAGSSAVKRLVYFTVDATDQSLSMYPEFLAFLRGLKPTTTLIKSASYLLHGNEFGNLKRTLLDISGFLVQDDTGLPYRSLVSEGWQVRLFGTYTVPIRPFQHDFQADLNAAYRAQPPEILSFPFGYFSRDRRVHPGNVMVARKLVAPDL